MLVRQKNKDTQANSVQAFLADPAMRLSCFIYVSSLFLLLMQRLVYSHGGSFHFAFVIYGLTIEFFLSYIVWLRYFQAKINRSLLGRYIYLIHTTLGLPFTVYIFHSQVYDAQLISLLRFFSVLTLLFSLVSFSPIKWHLAFFFIGTLFYGVLRDYTTFAKGPWISLGACVLVAVFVWQREKAAFFLGKTFFYSHLHRRRYENRHARLRLVFQEVLDEQTSARNAKRVLRGEQTLPTSGTYLMLSIAFSGLHTSLWEFQRTSIYSETAALRDFEQKWGMFLHHICTKLKAIGLELSLSAGVGTNVLLAGYLLQEYSHEQRKRNSFSPAQKRIIFESFFALSELLSFSEETRLGFESRGANGWYMNAIMTVGEAAAMQAGLKNPTLVFRGPLLEELSTIFQTFNSRAELGQTKAHSTSTINLPSMEDRLWVAPPLQPLYASRFEMSTARSFHGFKSPEFLLFDYTHDRTRFVPNRKFWDSLELQTEAES